MMAVYLMCLCLLGTQVTTISGFQSASRKTGSTYVRHGVKSISMGIDTSGLNILPDQEGLLNAVVGSTNSWTDASNALIVLGGLAYFANEKRPRGAARDDLIEMKKSTIPTANLGAFSRKFIPKGTTIGRYPGFLRSMTDALSSKSSDEARKAAQSYFFSVDEDQVLDPTTPFGDLEDTMKFLGVISVSTLIARINEPPLGGDVNLCTEIVANGVIVTAERDIFPGEELFMDYGPDYNRSNYVMPSPSATPSSSSSSSSSSGSRSTDNGVKERGVRNIEEENKGSDSDMFGRAVIEPRLTVPATPAVTPAPPAPVPASVRAPASLTTASASMFDALIGNSQAPTEEIELSKGAKAGNSRGILAGGVDDVQDSKGELTDAPQYRPALSVKESEKLLESLDDMTDAEVAAVLSKLKAAVSERIKSEVSDALLNKSDKKGIADTTDLKKMPRAPPVDPEMRKKYKTELDAIENELDRIYSDPLGVWQEFMANPEKFLEENETGLAEDEDLQ